MNDINLKPTLVKQTGKNNHNDRLGLYICNQYGCGVEFETAISGVNNGHTSSCGCLQKLACRNMSKLLITHGMTKTSEYKSWQHLKARCYNKKDAAYHKYGKRGITVCDRWLESFENFYEDMGNKPTKKHSIDRKNNSGNYCKENCRWATAKEQANNRRSNRLVEYNGKTTTLSELADLYNIKQSILYDRFFIRKWSLEKSLNKKPRSWNKKPVIDNNRNIHD